MFSLTGYKFGWFFFAFLTVMSTGRSQTIEQLEALGIDASQLANVTFFENINQFSQYLLLTYFSMKLLNRLEVKYSRGH